MVAALEGIRILDLTVWLQGPVGTKMLADMGAEVIKIEERVKGDPARGLAMWQGIRLESKGGRHAFYEHHNRNKKGITVDLKKEKGRQVIYRLVEKSDVFVQNYRKGVAARLGMDYETLRRHNPKIIYASVDGYGHLGPDSDKPAFDYTVQARSGWMSLEGEAGIPRASQVYVADQLGAIMLGYGILTALVARELHGVGQEVNVSSLGSLIGLATLNISMQLWFGRELARLERARSHNPLWNYYRCADGKWISLALLESDRYWSSFCKLVGIEYLEKDSRFENWEKRAENCEELISILDKVFATRSRGEWMQTFSKEPDFVYAPVNSLSDLTTDPQVIENAYIVDYAHPVWGNTKTVGVPVHLSRTPGAVSLPAPEFGEHTEMVLSEIAGYSWDEIAELREEEVI